MDITRTEWRAGRLTVEFDHIETSDQMIDLLTVCRQLSFDEKDQLTDDEQEVVDEHNLPTQVSTHLPSNAIVGFTSPQGILGHPSEYTEEEDGAEIPENETVALETRIGPEAVRRLTEPYPDAVERQHFPDKGYTVAKLPDGTLVKYNPLTNEEIGRKSVVGPVEAASNHVHDITSEYKKAREADAAARETGDYKAVYITNNDLGGPDHHRVIGIKHDDTREDIPQEVPRDFVSDFIVKARGVKNLKEFVQIGMSLVSSKEELIVWAQQNREQVPVLANISAELLSRKITTAIEIVGL